MTLDRRLSWDPRHGVRYVQAATSWTSTVSRDDRPRIERLDVMRRRLDEMIVDDVRTHFTSALTFVRQ